MAAALTAIASVGALTVGLYMLRRMRSSKWGLCTITRNLSGQVIIITGASGGLGEQVALDLAKRGAKVVLACRNFDKTREVLKMIREKSANNDVHYMHLDLASLDSVRTFVKEVSDAHPTINTLICNAGVWVPMNLGSKTKDGFEAHVGVNHLGHFLLTNLLLDKLSASVPSRIVVVSSSLMNSGSLNLTEHDHFFVGRQPTDQSKKSFAPIGYCDSKLMNVLFTKELAARTQGRGITSLSVCPGWCYTELSRNLHIPLYKKILFAPIAFLFMRSAARGAQNIIQAVVEEDHQLINGGLYRECKLAEAEEAKLSEMTTLQQELWQTSLNLTLEK